MMLLNDKVARPWAKLENSDVICFQVESIIFLLLYNFDHMFIILEKKNWARMADKISFDLR